MKKALVVLSGGQDSVTCLFLTLQNYDEVRAVTFDYGQRHRIEINSAIQIANLAGVQHDIVDCRGILASTSPLLSDSPLEKYENHGQMAQVIGSRTELTFVPMRNALFATIAANRAVLHGCNTIILGICEEDNANYPDCREEFLHALNSYVQAALGRDYNIEFEAPLLFYTKADSVRLASKLRGCMEALAYSHTSYDGKYPPTDMNHANVLRAHGFEQAGYPDPLVLRAWSEGLMTLPLTKNYEYYAQGQIEGTEPKMMFADFLSNFS